MTEPRPRPHTDPRRLDALRRWATLLDSAFRVPGTNFRFGLDAIIGLVPGIGDLSAPAFTVMLLLEGLRRRLPVVVQVRMVLNALVDMLLGLFPIVGDLVDIAWKANLRNLALLERHAGRPGLPPDRGDYVFVFVAIGLVALIALVPVLLLAWLIANVPRLV